MEEFLKGTDLQMKESSLLIKGKEIGEGVLEFLVQEDSLSLYLNLGITITPGSIYLNLDSETEQLLLSGVSGPIEDFVLNGVFLRKE